MKKCIIGVDGGATKTTCSLFDKQGNFVDVLDWGPMNHEVLAGGFSELETELDRMISTLLDRNRVGAADVEKSAFGLAGVDTQAQYRTIYALIQKMGFHDFILCNDAYLGVKAGCPSGYGICANNGTGCTVVGIDEKGKMFQVGGQGNLTYDVGGGGSLGADAVCCVYNYLFRCGRPTMLTDMIFKKIGITSKYDFMEAVTAKNNDGTFRIREYNKLLFEAARLGDEVSVEHLRHIGREYGLSITGLIGELDFGGAEPVSVVLSGSVNTHESDSALTKAIEETVRSRNLGMEFEFLVLDRPPVAGAVAWALGGLIGHEVAFEKVAEGFRGR